MVVPGFRPLLGVVVNAPVEEVVEKPYVGGYGGVEAMVSFELSEEIFPFLPESVRNVVP